MNIICVCMGMDCDDNVPALGFCSHTSAVRQRFPRLLRLVGSHIYISKFTIFEVILLYLVVLLPKDAIKSF